jgi:hypothetical protein
VIVWLLTAVVLALTPAQAPAAQASSGAWLPVASDGRNVWVVTDRMTSDKGVERTILHHAADMNGPYARTVVTMDRSPLAMSADKGKLWMVLPALDVTRQRREVYSVTASMIELTGAYQYLPEGRLHLWDSLPDGGAFAGIANNGLTLMALRTPGAPERLSGNGWERVADAPEGLALVQWGRNPAVVLTREPMQVSVPNAAGVWTVATVQLPPGASARAVTGSSRPTIVATLADGTPLLAYVEGAVTAPIVTLPRVEGPWAVAGLGNGFVLLEAAKDGSVAMRTIDGLNGKISEPTILTAPPSQTGEWIHLPLLAMLAIALVLTVVLFRHVGPQSRMAEPYGFQALPAGRRIAALLIDLIPGVVLVLALGYEPAALLRLPMMSATGAAAVPGVTLILVTLGVCVLTELVTGTSAGKWIVGGRVARMNPPGAKPAVWQVLTRNVFKGMVLLVPIVGLLVLWGRGGRGVGEVLSATAVIERRPRTAPLKPDSADRR